MFRIIILPIACLASLGANLLPAQEVVLEQKFGQGVHAYFAGDYSQAFEHLTTVIESGSKDPRAFYFRGLSYLELGRPQEARQDFQKGADLESRDVNKFYNVPMSLERVQGPARVELENYRANARAVVMQQVDKLRKARYEAVQREESRVTREPPATVAEPIKTPEPTAQPAAEAAAETAPDPFAAPDEKAAPKAIKKAAKAVKKPAADESAEKPAEGAAEEKKAAEAPAGDDPFANPPAKPAAKPATGKKAAKAADAAAEGQDEKAPAMEEKPADNANPFGEEPAAGEKKPAAEEKKAAAKKPAKPAKKAAEKKASSDDPFSQ